MDLSSSGPDLAIPNPMILQHFYMGLSKESAQFLNIASGGAFLHLPISKGRAILDTILGNTPYIDVHDYTPEEKDNPTPMQEEVSTVESLPIPSKSLAIDPIPKPFLGTPKKE